MKQGTPAAKLVGHLIPILVMVILCIQTKAGIKMFTSTAAGVDDLP